MQLLNAKTDEQINELKTDASVIGLLGDAGCTTVPSVCTIMGVIMIEEALFNIFAKF